MSVVRTFTLVTRPNRRSNAPAASVRARLSAEPLIPRQVNGSRESERAGQALLSRPRTGVGLFRLREVAAGLLGVDLLECRSVGPDSPDDSLVADTRQRSS